MDWTFGILLSVIRILWLNALLSCIVLALQIWTFFFFVIIPACAYADQPNTRRAKCVSRIPIGLIVCTVIFTILQICFIVFTIAIPIGVEAFALSIGRFLPLAISWYLAIRVPRWPWPMELDRKYEQEKQILRLPDYSTSHSFSSSSTNMVVFVQIHIIRTL